MNLLYPLLLAGIAAVALPIALHMIRRHTRNRVPFSSLLFLRTTPPRYRHRSRLEHIPLLILRCLAICLLALAFARPFLVRSSAVASVRPDRRVVVLVDTSASMRREDLWDRAVEEADSILRELGPSDRASLMTFHRAVGQIVGFEQWTAIEPGQRVPLTVRELAQRSPGWAGTDLGGALVAAAEAIEDDEANAGRQGLRQIVLISDLQEGAERSSLLAYDWPDRTHLIVRTISSEVPTNASAQLLTDRGAPFGSQADARRIRVTNSAEATSERFQLIPNDGAAIDVYAPPGRGTTVALPSEPNTPTATRLLLRGDDHPFDNALYLAPRVDRPLNILYVGDHDPNDTREMLYYLRQALQADATVASHVTHRTGVKPLRAGDVERAQAVVVTEPLRGSDLTTVRGYLASGGMVLLVLKSTETTSVMAGLAGLQDLECREAAVDDYAMLDRLEFEHPMLQAFADPRFADFTRIHFWRHRQVDLSGVPDARALAWFDRGDPAWFEVGVEEGLLLVWTSGWHPADSDLALSSKFVPLLYSAFQYGGALTDRPSQYFVGDPVPVPEATQEVRRPDGSVVNLDGDEQVFKETDLPGIYTLVTSTEEQRFAVNVPVAESRTDPMAVEDLARFGVSLEPTSDVAQPAVESAAQRLSLREMESGQKLWRWILAAALIVLLLETWLSGRLARPAAVPEGEQT